ncbi:tRNA uridine-5-carboxymethylaminomethyl(34) synthesis enzyme MnmG [Candidatus Margulisiibacteriota bacterium]
MENKDVYDVIVVGAGHAGVEACLAAARIGCKTLVIAVNLDTIAWMPCNPAIGGPAKGQIVSEIDALGGEMGKAADATFIQMKMLNRSRGPAVHALRSQHDKYEYHAYMKKALEKEKHIDLRQDIVDEIIVENGNVTGVKTQLGKVFKSKSVVITSGTFLKGKIHIGLRSFKAGRISEFPAEKLSDSLTQHGIKLGRLKTGTPPRIDSRTINYNELNVQPGDNEFLHFSFKTKYNEKFNTQIPCYITYTNPDTHTVILNNLDRSPLYQKKIKGVGPRYCPSIEDKVVRFKDKDRHQIFIEPEGKDTVEIYLQGLNTSLPEDVQEKMIHTMAGLEQAKIIKAGYAVEYDFIYPYQLKYTLESKNVGNLFFAGQINGTSGYEEAAGQGLVAGINAARKTKGLDEFTLNRENSYIGTLIDDLIKKDIKEPYRMMTSRSEYRLFLRQDNAIYRLARKGWEIGLISDEEIGKIEENKQNIYLQIEKWKKINICDQTMQKFNLNKRIKYYDFLKRSEVSIDLFSENKKQDYKKYKTQKSAYIEICYEGYLKRQLDEIKRKEKMEGREIPEDFDYDELVGLKVESRERFKENKPKTIRAAKLIAGINPVDIDILLLYMEKKRFCLGSARQPLGLPFKSSPSGAEGNEVNGAINQKRN